MTTALAQFQRPTLRAKLEKTVGRVKSVTELLGDIGEALAEIDKSHDIGAAISGALPWAADHLFKSVPVSTIVQSGAHAASVCGCAMNCSTAAAISAGFSRCPM